MSSEIKDAAIKLQAAEQCRVQGQYLKAQKLCEQLLKKYKDYAAAHHTLGLIFADQGKPDSALFHLAQANAYNPDNPYTLIALGTVYYELQARDVAIEYLDRAAKITPNDPLMLLTLAETLKEERDYGRAIQCYEAVLKQDPTWLEASLGLSRAYQFVGNYEASEKILLQLYNRGLRTLPLASGLASLPKLPAACDFYQLIEKADAGKNSKPSRSKTRQLYLYHQYYHQRGEYEQAWDRLVLANKTKYNVIKIDQKTNEHWQKESMAATVASKSPAYSDPDFPVTSLYILGTSRSGKTTIESLISTSSEIRAGFENPLPLNAIRKTLRAANLISTTQYGLLPEKLEEDCRQRYCKELQERAGGCSVFTNTAPSKIHDVYRLISIFPKAKFLFVKRKEVDLLSKIFANEYQDGNFYAYRLQDIRNHIAWYNKMIDVLHEKYPEQTAIVQYEQVIADPSILKGPVEKLTGITLQDLVVPGHDVDHSNPYLSMMEAQLEELVTA